MTEPITVSPAAAPRPAVSSQSPDGRNDEVVDRADLGQRMWDFLTGRQAAIHGTFDEPAVEVPRDTGGPGDPPAPPHRRAGARVRVGAHELGYHREEYADHGRPHGGRIGGELGRQRPQPPRPGRTAGPAF